MKSRLGSASARAWNQKNLPSDLERFDESPGDVATLVRQVPAATAALFRSRRGLIVLSLAVVGALGLIWYLNRED